MKSILSLALLGLAICSTANAATLVVEPLSGAPAGKYSIYLSGGAENNTFNTVTLDTTPAVGTTFGALSSGAGKLPADVNTFRNRVLDGDTLDGGLGWSMVGTSTTATSLGFTGGPLGGNITTANDPGGRLFLGNVVLNPIGGSGVAKVTLFAGSGATVFTATVPFGVPEPASIVMVGMSLLGLAAGRRRS